MKNKVYVMESCPDCVEVKQRYSNDPDFELVDIGKQAREWYSDHLIKEVRRLV